MIILKGKVVQFLLLSILTTVFLLLGSEPISAQEYCGSARTQMVVGCGPPPNCEPITEPLDYNCYNYRSNVCEGYVNPNTCTYNSALEMCKIGNASWVSIACGSGGGGGGGCPDGTTAQCTNDCKRISGCPVGARRENCGLANDGEQKVICHQCQCIPNATPTPTLTPTPSPTPTPIGTIQARAVQVDSTADCATIRSVPITDGQITGTTLGFTPSSASQPTSVPVLQSGANYVTFSNVVTGSYTLDPIPPSADWAYTLPCWTNVTTGLAGESLSAALGANETLTWDVGYTFGTAWVQTEGGDVYASGSIRSYIPQVTPRVFNADGAGGYPGVVTYGTSVDFDSQPFEDGSTLVSSTNWYASESHMTMDYYDYFYHKLGSPTVTDNALFSNITSVTKTDLSTDRTTPYYITGDMGTSGNWTVGDGESIIFLVNGNLTINGNINITANSTGFIAFIVNGTITVDSSVGTTALSSSPNVEGIYVATTAGHSGGIYTGISTANATAKFVGKGMFISDNFTLQRDLDGFGGNVNGPAELFEYNPQLLLTMPDAMKEMPVTWQEVAP